MKELTKRAKHLATFYGFVDIYMPQAPGTLGRKRHIEFEGLWGYPYRRHRMLAFPLAILLVDNERVGKRGKTQQWIKRREDRRNDLLCEYCARVLMFSF